MSMTKRMRVVSLLPSATDLLAYIQQDHLLVGRSHECDYPKKESILALPVVTRQRTVFTTSADVDRQVSTALKSAKTSTISSSSPSTGENDDSACSLLMDPNATLYTLDVEKIKELKPDLILTQDICNVCSVNSSQVKALVQQMQPNPPEILSLNPNDLSDVLKGVLILGQALGVDTTSYFNALQTRIHQILEKKKPNVPPKKVLFLEWLEPAYVGGHWTPQLIAMAGGSHPLNPAPIDPTASDTLTEWWRFQGAPKSTPREVDQILSQAYDLVIICPCGLDVPATEKELTRMAQESENQAWWVNLVSTTPTWLVDGNEHFNRPGPRLVDALEFLVSVLHNGDSTLIPTFPCKLLKKGSPIFAKKAGHQKIQDPEKILEIERLHEAACRNCQDTYTDPETGYRVLTSQFLKDRGTCCGNACRHCPYGHANVSNPAKQKNQITSSVIVNYERSFHPGTKVKVLFWSGGKDSWLTWLHLKEEQSKQQGEENEFEVVLMTTFGIHTQRASIQNIDIRDIIQQSKSMKTPLLAVPLEPHSDYAGTVLEALTFLVQRTGCPVQSLVFGDLHLEDIRAWRDHMFSTAGYVIETPLFGVPYPVLLERLWKSVTERKLSISVCASECKDVALKQVFDPAFVERTQLLNIDAMGENGEFHTIVQFP